MQPDPMHRLHSRRLAVVAIALLGNAFAMANPLPTVHS